jgi:RNA polymerase sigma-70 factor, ECF subfamily
VRVTSRRDPSTDAAFEQFFLDEHRRLVAIGLAMTPDREAARDAAQEALARAFADWDRVRALDQPGAWVRRVLINILIDKHRRGKREQLANVRLSSRPTMSIPEPAVDEFIGMIRRLPERQRIAVVLYYLDDLSVDVVAETMNVADGTVKSLLFKARQSLSSELATIEEER